MTQAVVDTFEVIKVNVKQPKHGLFGEVGLQCIGQSGQQLEPVGQSCQSIVVRQLALQLSLFVSFGDISPRADDLAGDSLVIVNDTGIVADPVNLAITGTEAVFVIDMPPEQQLF